ncbi:methyl-accepting chemotaxis protein [Paenibacillus sp. SYP-B4298]|uniref:methyl-accepting chemotaxis protein n=1 Tax=Paenibacillus sp. SYP-B4298 TaxID=2996034 RepID=UPI0022DD838C|nr:methyl-accepting chemotaxis protein [Paenibacillus sp. SYP-B4298]
MGLLRVRLGHPGSDLLPDYNPDHIVLQIGDLYHDSSVLRHVPSISRDPRDISLYFASITASFHHNCMSNAAAARYNRTNESYGIRRTASSINDMKRGRVVLKSLHLRIMIVFSLLIVLSSSVMAYIIYASSMKLITQSIGEQARSIAQYAADQIDLERYRDITPKTGETPYYTELRQRFNELREANHLKYLYTMAARDNNGQREYYYIVDGMPVGAKGDDVSELGKVETEAIPLLEEAIADRQSKVGELTRDDTYGATVSAYVPIVDANGQLLGALGADFDATSVYDLLEKNRRTMLLVASAILVVSLAIIYLLSKMIVSPILRLTRSMNTIEQGDLTPVIHVKGKDEISRLSSAFRSMIQVLRSMIQSIHGSSRQLRQSATSMSASAETTHEASGKITRLLQEAAVNAEAQAKYSSETSRAISEVAGGVERVSHTLSFVAEASQEAAEVSQAGNGLVQQAVDKMEEIGRFSQMTTHDMNHLAARSEEVGEMVAVIRDISSQTNLLALNASIEAARAGEHGRGFTVVAEQVRKLAEQADQSAERIGSMLGSMVDDIQRAVSSVQAGSGRIGEGLSAVQAAGESFARIRHAVERVAAEIQDVSAVSEEISASTEEVVASAAEMEGLSRHNSDHFGGIAEAAEQQLGTVEQMKEAAVRLEEMSGELERLAGRFRI